MYTNIEFLDAEPIENVITCMHHKMDKVIFFGYKEEIENYQTRTERFLRQRCGVQEVKFCAIEKMDLNAVITGIQKEVDTEKALGNKVYFDITGGESLFLVAFGMLSDKLEKPMHMYDVEKDELIQLGQRYEDNIQDVEGNHVTLDLSTYIEMSGAKIDDTWFSHVDVNDTALMERVDALWEMVQNFKQDWNVFCGILRDKLSVEKSLDASCIIDQSKTRRLDIFHRFMQSLKQIGAVSYYSSQVTKRSSKGWVLESEVSVTYASEAWKECITKAGTALELYVYKKAKDAGKEALQSVHIDWDSRIASGTVGEEKDVLNEIDVLVLEGNIPTFISCKCGNMSKGKALEPMYELETVASRFGGKYAQKVLATLHPVSGVYALRAEEMGIQLDCYGEE